MRNKLFIFIAACMGLTLFVTLGCKKEKGVFTIKGTISDATFGVKMANETLLVSIQNAGASVFAEYGSVVTDANGQYSIDLERGEYDKIKFTLNKENYFQLEYVIPVSVLTLNETHVVNQSTTAKAWARLIFIHQSGDPNAVLEYTKNDGKQDCFECCPKTTQSLSGYVYDTVYCINDGNTNYSYTYTVVGTPTLGTKTCYTPVFDTGEVVLNY